MFTKQQIRKLIIPLMIEQVLTSLMGAADTLMVSNAGSAAISAVSLVDSINVLMIYVFTALATGGAIVCAQYLGRGDAYEAAENARQMLFTVLAISVLVSIVCMALNRPLLRLIFGKVEQDVMDASITYFLITTASYPFIALYNAGAALFRVEGNSRLSLIVSTISNVVNIVGNAILIFGFNMGVAGAAIATLFSRIISAVVLMICLRHPGRRIVIDHYARIRPDSARIRRILKMGVPNGIEQGMFQFGKLAIQSSVSMMGTLAIAAQGMTSVLEALLSRASEGVALGLMTIVGQCLGAGCKDEARKYVVRMSGWAEAAMLVSCAIMAASVRQITRIAGMEPEAAQLCCRLMYIICIVKPVLWVPSFVPVYGMRAAGDVRYSMVISSASMWIFRVAIATILVRAFHMGPLAVWIGMFADWLVRGIWFTIRFYSGKWMKKVI